MAQLLLFSIYATVMGILIFTVVDESMSGVVILIFGALVSIYLLFAIGAGLASRPLRQNIPERNLMDELGSINPPPTQIKLGPVTLKELTPEQKRVLKWIIYLSIALNFIIFLIDISINEGLI